MHSGNIQITRFGHLTVGDVPRVVGTITTFEALSSFPERCGGQCDIAEIRLDVIGEKSAWREHSRRIQQAGTPTLLTIRSMAEGGRSKLSPLEALCLVDGAWDCVAAIDVEHQRGEAREAAKKAQGNGKAVVASFHDFSGTPSRDKLERIMAAAAVYADVVKISTFVNSPDDILLLESLLAAERKVPLCIIGMGPLGTPTRIGFPALGSCLTYGYLDSPAAPGQLAASALVAGLRAAPAQHSDRTEPPSS